MGYLTNHLNRRQFIKKTSGSVALASIIPTSVWSASKNTRFNERITLGFIGLGKQGTYLLGGFVKIPEFQVLSVCDVDSLKLNRAKNIVEEYYGSNRPTGVYRGCHATKDFREIITRPDIDAVVIATPDHWHAVQVIMAARAGKDIYCEKPLSLTISQARAMVNEVRKYDRVFQTGSMQRSDNRFRHACELVRNGYIGEVQRVRVSIATGFQNHPQFCDLPGEKIPQELDWDMWLGPAPWRPFHPILSPPISFDGFPAWRDYFDYSGGGMTDWGAHHFDIAQWGLGMDDSGPVEIIPPNGREYPLLTYHYSNGVELTTDFEGNGILFTGTEGTVDVNRSHLITTPTSLVQIRIKPDDIHLYRSQDHKRNWLQCIRSHSRPITDVEIGCRSVTVCHLGNIAVQLQRPVTWDPEKEVFVNDPEANRTLARAMRSPWYI